MSRCGERKEYLICSNDYLETAFYIGTASECAALLGLKNKDVLYSAISHGRNRFMKGFFKIEVAPPEEEKNERKRRDL